jgi:hypothetical protein
VKFGPRVARAGWRGPLGWVSTAAVAAVGFLLLHVWVPSEDPRRSVCILRRFFGLSCPTCGMTRAFAHLAKGEWSAAWTCHPLAIPLALEMLALWIAWGVILRRKTKPETGTSQSPWLTLLWLNLAVFGGVWILRLLTATLPP